MATDALKVETSKNKKKKSTKEANVNKKRLLLLLQNSIIKSTTPETITNSVQTSENTSEKTLH